MYLWTSQTEIQWKKQVIGALKPDVVIHCAAWTAVDLTEDDDKKQRCMQSTQMALRI